MVLGRRRAEKGGPLHAMAEAASSFVLILFSKTPNFDALTECSDAFFRCLFIQQEDYVAIIDKCVEEQIAENGAGANKPRTGELNSADEQIRTS